MSDVAATVQEYILNEFLPGENPEDLANDTPLITGGILDSISTLRLVGFLEEKFGITLDAYEAGVDHLDSIDQIVELVQRKRGNA